MKNYFKIDLLKDENGKIVKIIKSSFIDECLHKELFKPQFFKYGHHTFFIAVKIKMSYSKKHSGYLDTYVYKVNNNLNTLLEQMIHSIGSNVFELFGKYNEIDEVIMNNFDYKTIIKYIKDDELKEKLKIKYSEEII